MKKDTVFGLILVMLTGIGLVLSCENDTKEIKSSPPVEVPSDAMELVLFEQKKIEIDDPEFQGKTLVYSSSDPSVATVSADGVVTAVGVNNGDPQDTLFHPRPTDDNNMFESVWGETLITVKTPDNRYETKIPVYVTMFGYEDILDVPSLHDQFKDYFNFGSLLDATIATDNVINKQLKRHFNIFTPQNGFKPSGWSNLNPSMSVEANVLNAAQSLVVSNGASGGFTMTNSTETSMISALAAGYKYHYHTLFWHNQNQAWWNQFIGGAGNGQNESGAWPGTNPPGTRASPWAPPLNGLIGGDGTVLTGDKSKILALMKYWVDYIMDKSITVNGTQTTYGKAIYSWDVLNEAMLTYPERLKARSGTNGYYDAQGSIQREGQLVNGRGNWVVNASDPGYSLKGWGDGFSWKDALRYGTSDEECWDNKLRGNAWIRALGPDAVYYMFKFARLGVIRNGNPTAILYYNDYDTFRPNKAQLIYDMVVELNARWASDSENPRNDIPLINGIGAQEHNNIDPQSITVDGIVTKLGPTVEGIENQFQLWSQISNMNMAVSEMDLRVYDAGGTGTPLPDNILNSGTRPTFQNQIDQAKLYGEMFKIYLKYSRNANGSKMDRVTFWGHNDQNNWMSAGRPLWFDGSNSGKSYAKPAYYLVQKVLKEYKAAANQ